jgi:hypothetical protein
MKTGKTIQELAGEITRRSESKRDFRVDTRQLTMNAETEGIEIEGIDSIFTPNAWAHRQIGTYTKIPAPYYDKMRENAPSLLAENVNHWFKNTTEPDRRLVRTLDGNMRAFMSNRYRILDNDQVLEGVLPVLAERPDLEIVSCDVTEKKMYLKAVFTRLTADLAVGDAVQAGISISNSEDGRGSIRIEPLLYRLVCLNGMVRSDQAMRKYHVGRNADSKNGEAYEVYQDDTIIADDRAFQLKMRDVVTASLSEASFQDSVLKFRETKERKMEGSPIKVVEEIANRLTLTEGERDSVLTHLLRGDDLSQFGLINAVTRASQDISDYDRASELEQFGGQILDLAPSEWKSMAVAV